MVLSAHESHTRANNSATLWSIMSALVIDLPLRVPNAMRKSRRSTVSSDSLYVKRALIGPSVFRSCQRTGWGRGPILGIHWYPRSRDRNMGTLPPSMAIVEQPYECVDCFSKRFSNSADDTTIDDFGSVHFMSVHLEIDQPWPCCRRMNVRRLRCSAAESHRGHRPSESAPGKVSDMRDVTDSRRSFSSVEESR